MKILIAGAGTVGGWLGARLADQHEVTLLGRPPLATAVAAHGLRVEGLTDITARPTVLTEPLGQYDAAFLTCKAHGTATLGAAIAPLVNGPIASLQNGLGNAEKLQAIAPGRVAACLTSHGIHAPAPGRLIHAGAGATKVGPVPGQPAGEADAVARSLLHDAGLDPEYHREMRGHIWQKAIVNAGINPVAALHDVPNGALLDVPLSGLVSRLVVEAVRLATAARVELPAGDLASMTRAVCERTGDNFCSMVQDVRASRPTEIEQINGRMVRLAELLLVSMPANESIYGRMKDLETGYLGAQASEATAWAELHAPPV